MRNKAENEGKYTFTQRSSVRVLLTDSEAAGPLSPAASGQEKLLECLKSSLLNTGSSERHDALLLGASIGGTSLVT